MFDGLITKYSRVYGVPESWIRGVISVESSFNPNAVGTSGEIGLMQLLPSTAYNLGFRGTLQQLSDPEMNIELGTQLLAQLRAVYGDLKSVLSAYNSGAANNYKSNPVVAAYVDKVIRAMPGGGGAAVLLIVVYFLFRRKP